MPINPTIYESMPEDSPEVDQEFSTSDGVDGSSEEGVQNDPKDIGNLDVNLDLDEDQETEIVTYLEENLVNMSMSEDEQNRIKSYLSMYDMAARQRDFPYENAPSIPSSDAYEKLNEWLDKAEVAFLITNGTFSIDREEVTLEEEEIRRMEKTYHKKYFWGSGLADELRLILFETGYIGGSICSIRENFEVEPQREKVVIKTVEDLGLYQQTITRKAYEEAQRSISKGETYLTERDILKVISAGSKIKRINQTKFLYPQNETDWKKWDVVSEIEYYTKSTLLSMAYFGELDLEAVNKAIANNRERVLHDGKKTDKMPEGIRPSALDTSSSSNTSGIKEHGDSYDDEFAVYRTTLKYKVATDQDPSGILRSWVEVVYCPAGGNILSSKFCKYGFPYRVIQYRPVPHRAVGLGIAQARYPFNVFDADMKSLFMASLEQEIGAPTIIKLNSSLWSSGWRTYPGSTTYTENPATDVVPFKYPEKSRLAVEGMKIILGSSPGANKGAGYASGKREEILQNQQNDADKSRMHAIAVGLDELVNMAWKIDCQVAKMNDKTTKWIKWVYDAKPSNTRLYILSNEMNPEIVWTSTLSAKSMSPDAMFANAQQLYELFHRNVPVSVNSSRLSIAWLNFLAGFVSQMDDKNKKDLLPNEQDFMQMQQQLGAQGGERPNEVLPQQAQSPTTPFHRPPSGENQQRNGAPSRSASSAQSRK